MKWFFKRRSRPSTLARDDREARLMAMGAMYIELDQILEQLTAEWGDRSTLAERKDLAKNEFANWDLGVDHAGRAQCRQTLAQWWDITDNATAIEKLSWLLQDGHRTEFEHFLAVLDTSGGDKAAMRAKLGDSVDDGAYAQAVHWRPLLTRSGILAWDLARAIHVMRLSYNGGLIDEDRAWTILGRLEMPAAQIASWQEFGHSYLAGLEFWSGQAEAQYREIVARLLRHPYSPWVHFPWPQSRAPSQR